MADQPGASSASAQPGPATPLTSPDPSKPAAVATAATGAGSEEKAATPSGEEAGSSAPGSGPKSIDNYSEDELRAHPRLSQFLRDETNRELRRYMAKKDRDDRARAELQKRAQQEAEWDATVEKADVEDDYDSTKKVVSTVKAQRDAERRRRQVEAVAFEMAQQLRQHDVFKAIPEETFWAEMDKPTFGEFVASVVNHAYGARYVPKETVESDYIPKATVERDYVLRANLADEYEAQRADERTRLMGGMPNPDLTPSAAGSSTSGRHVYTRAELRDMPMHVWKERKGEIERQVAAGLVK